MKIKGKKHFSLNICLKNIKSSLNLPPSSVFFFSNPQASSTLLMLSYVMIITHISILVQCVQTCLPTRWWALGGQESLLFCFFVSLGPGTWWEIHRYQLSWIRSWINTISQRQAEKILLICSKVTDVNGLEWSWFSFSCLI